MADFNKSDLIAAFNMPHEAAVLFLQSKGLVVTDSWRDLWQAAHARAFTVARSAGFDVLADIREALVEALNQGDSYKEFSKKLTPILQAKGWWGKAIDLETGEIIKMYEGSTRPVMLGSPRRLKLIYEQNLQTAFMAGRHRGMMAAVKTHPYWQYVAVLDNRTRPAHKALAGKVFKYDDAVWSVAYPPNGWRCRCRVRPLSSAGLSRESLTAESANGYINELDVPRKDGSVIKLKTIKLPNMLKPFKPDLGWDYNPAINYHDLKAA